MMNTNNGRRIWVLILTSLAAFMVGLDALVVSTALSTIHRDLGASIEALEWTVNAYTLSFAVLLMTAAALGDRLGRRRFFIVGLGLFIIGSAGCALAPDVTWLIVARVVQGSGSAVMAPLGLTLLSAAYSEEQRGKALGVYGSVTGLSLIAGPIVGGAIAQGLDWRWIFWINVPIGLIVIPLAWRLMQESFGERTPLDFGGLVLVTGASLGLVWGLVRGNSVGWSSAEVLITLVGGVLLAGAFVVWELNSRVPMVPMRLFRLRSFTASNSVIFLLTAALFGSLFFLAQFLQTALGYGPLAAGLRLLPWTATLFVIAPISGALVNRVGVRWLVAGGAFLQAVGFAWISLIISPMLAYPALIAPLIIAGAGVSLALPATQYAAVSAVARQEIGKASGVFSTLRQLGGAFGVAMLAAAFSYYGSFHSPQTFSNGLVPALALSATLSLIGALVGLVLPVGRRQVVPEQSVSSSVVTEQVGGLEESALR